MRDTIFISHATPEDNDFTLWLAARLAALGYKTWVDKQALIGGEKFWDEIDNVIRNDAKKVVLVYSRNICANKKPGRLKDGISKELSLAESVCKERGLDDFTILLNIDGSPFNLFIGTDRYNQIQFADDWAEGLHCLVEKLEKDGVPTAGKEAGEFSEWFQTSYFSNRTIVPRKELYYLNLWPIPDLPSKFYVFRFETEKEAKRVYLQDHTYPVSKASNLLASFAPLDANLPDNEEEGHCEPIVHEVATEDAVMEREISGFANPRDARNQLVFLLSRVFHEMMKARGLFWYELANRRQAYFYTPAALKSHKVSFRYPHRKRKTRKTKYMMGRYKNLGYWHYAVSCRPQLQPEPAFSLKSHLVFTSNLFQVWDEKAKMHTHRRSKGKRWFNEEWRDLLLAFIEGLKNDQGKTEIALEPNTTLCMPSLPMTLWAGFGYDQPASRDRLAALADEKHDEAQLTDKGATND